jgi:hypothetical protein
MKTIPSLLLSITILLFASCLVFAQQNRWTYVGAGVSGTQFFIDRKSIEIKGNRVRVWNKYLYADDSYRLSLMEWACSEKKYLVLDESIYDPNGRVIVTDKVNTWFFVTPDSMSEGLYKAVCGSSKPTSSRITSDSKMMAQIIVKSANVRTEPHMRSSMKRRVKSGEQFALANEESVNGWYQILISGTNNIGCIHGSTIKLIESPNQSKIGKRRKQ